MKKLLLTMALALSFTFNAFAQTTEEQAMQEMEAIEYLKEENKQEYFNRYTEIVDKYSEHFDSPETVYDVYDRDEIDLFAKLVEAEASNGGFLEKANVASIIWNRLESPNFPDTITNVIYEKSQFTPVSDGNLKRAKPNKDTYQAIEYTFMIENTCPNGTYFHSGKSGWHERNLNYLFKDDIGHRFYSLK